MSLDPLVPAEEEGPAYLPSLLRDGIRGLGTKLSPVTQVTQDRREERPQSGVLDKGIRCLSPRELNFYLFRQPTAFLTVQLGFISHSKCSVPKRIYKQVYGNMLK